MPRLLFIALCPLLLTGCVGLAVGTFGKHESVSTDFKLAKQRNQFDYGPRADAYRKSDVIEHWGEPDRVQRQGQCEVLVYKDGTSWSGVGAFVGVVPVPVGVPTGSYKNRFYVRDDTVLGLVQEYGDVSRTAGYLCGDDGCRNSAGEKVSDVDAKAEQTIGSWCD